MNLIKTIRTLVNKNTAQENDKHSLNRNSDAIDFLPAALEILEKPPSPIGRWLGYCLMLLFTLAVLWAVIGKVDVVASAEGKIIPSGRVKSIQPSHMGVIQAIYVNDGQYVEKGQDLIALDHTLTVADKRRLENEVGYLQHNLFRQQVFQDILQRDQQGQAVDTETIDAMYNEHLERYQQRLASQGHHSQQHHPQQHLMLQQVWQEYQAQIAILNSQYQHKLSELDGVDASIQALQTTVPMISKRVAALQSMHDQGLGAEMQLLELKEQQVTQQQSLIAEQARKRQLQAAVAEAQQTLAAQKNTARKTNLETIENLQQQLQSTQQELQKANKLYHNQVLQAPVAGRIQQLAVHTIGGVVEEAQVLMQIVPEDAYLEVEAVLQNKDVGFIHQGQRAEVKIHTFPFTKYGIIDAEVIDITADAIQTEQQGLVYSVRLKMQQTKLKVDRNWVDLIPGMAVTAEVKTNKRRVIDFFMSPLLRYKDESIRER